MRKKKPVKHSGNLVIEAKTPLAKVMATATENDSLPPCEFRITTDDGTLRCSEAAKLAQLPILSCDVGADACRHCCKQPSRPNSVIASMAIRASEKNLSKDDALRVFQAAKPYLQTVNQPRQKRATAADLPCVWRGDLLRMIDCELCGGKGEKVEVHQCRYGDESHEHECTPSRWTNDATKAPKQSCLTCQHRSEPIAINLEGLNPQPQPQQPQPNILKETPATSSQLPCKLTIGMACYDDEPGVFFTVQALRMYHADILKETNAEILIVDSNPTSKHGKAVRELCEHWGGNPDGSRLLRYIPAEFAKGTSAPRDLVFREARGEIVICIDCHVLLAPGALKSLMEHFDENPDSIDLIQGPMLHHGGSVYATHMRRAWGSDGMLGKWDTDERIHSIDKSPFEIPGHGMGLFACRKLAWRGFNPAFKGFGGEEIQYHDKVRTAGGKCLCLPELQWLHKFSRVDGVPYRLNLEDRFRNYLIGHAELGKDITPVIAQFAGRINEASLGKIVAEVATMFRKEVAT